MVQKLYIQQTGSEKTVNIGVREDALKSYAAEFSAKWRKSFTASDADIIVIAKKQNGCEAWSVEVSGLYIDGVQQNSANDAVTALNEFIGLAFKSGGGGVSPNSPTFAPAGIYEQDKNTPLDVENKYVTGKELQQTGWGNLIGELLSRQNLQVQELLNPDDLNFFSPIIGFRHTLDGAMILYAPIINQTDPAAPPVHWISSNPNLAGIYPETESITITFSAPMDTSYDVVKFAKTGNAKENITVSWNSEGTELTATFPVAGSNILAVGQTYQFDFSGLRDANGKIIAELDLTLTFSCGVADDYLYIAQAVNNNNGSNLQGRQIPINSLTNNHAATTSITATDIDGNSITFEKDKIIKAVVGKISNGIMQTSFLVNLINLTDLTLSDSMLNLTVIGYRFLYNAPNLRNLKLPNVMPNLVTINEGFLYGASNLQNLKLPNMPNLLQIKGGTWDGDGSFYNTAKLLNIDMGDISADLFKTPLTYFFGQDASPSEPKLIKGTYAADIVAMFPRTTAKPYVWIEVDPDN